jgi:general secretion pathway protein M
MNELKQYVAQFRTWWSERQPRERSVLAAGAALVALALLYFAIWEPLTGARHNAERDLAQQRAVATRIEQIAAEVEHLRGSGAAAAANRNLSLVAAVDQSSRLPQLGKAPSRIQPEGDREVKVWLDDIAFNAVLDWTQQLQKQYGIAVSSAEIERKGEGIVSARLSLVRP